MARLFQREVKVQVGELLIHSQLEVVEGKTVKQGLDVVFEAERSTQRSANTAKVVLFNLNPQHRAAVQQLEKDDEVSIEAGYAGSIGEIFRGNIRDGNSTRNGPDWATTVEAGDGEVALRSARINESFPAGTALETVMRRLTTKLGVGKGNSIEKLARSFVAQGRQLGNEFLEGTAVSGSVADQLTSMFDSVGLEWSVQNGAMQVLDKGGALDRTAVLLNKSTGLVGSPEVGKDGVLKVVALLQAEVFPGRKISVEAKGIGGSIFTVRRVKYTGDTAGQPWYVEIEAKRA